MAAGDVESVRAIDEASFTRPWSTAFLRDQVLEAPGRRHLVAVSDGTVVGHAGLLVVADEGHVTAVAVLPGARRAGVGSALLAEVCRASVGLGLDAMTLEVRVSNTAARALYGRFGFMPSGVRPGYYQDDGEDALVMWAHDVQAPEFMRRVEAAGARAGGAARV